MNIDHENMTPVEIVDLLRRCDDAYFNDDNPFLSDSMYDFLRQYLRAVSPTEPYLIGVGSPVRGGKVPLPYPMPSLNQVEIGEITSWVQKNNLTNERIIASNKMDGASVEIIYDEQGKLQIAFSRGDGIEGADITRHVRKIKAVPQKVPCGHLVIRGEVQLSETNFKLLRERVKSRSGEPYRNSRNMVSGLMNAESNADIVYDYLEVFAYTILARNNSSTSSKEDDLIALGSYGFKTPGYCSFVGSMLTDERLAHVLNNVRETNDYAIDGLVLDVDNASLRREMDAEIDLGSNPRSAVKYKVADATNQHVATVTHVEWNISKHGYLKPVVCFEPFELCGVTIRNATGFNAKFIRDNRIGPGAKVQMTRSGDVIPFIQNIVKPASEPQLPTDPCEWNDTGVDLVLRDKDANEEVKVQQLIDFCSSLDFPHLKEGNVRALYEQGVKTPEDVVNVELVKLALVLGANGIKAHHGVRERLNDVMLSDVMGAHPAFGRGIGQRKMKKLIEALGEDFTSWTVERIVEVEGFDSKTAQLIMTGIPSFETFYNNTKDSIVYKGAIKTQGKLSGHKIVMTGFRDKALEQKVEELGGENQSGVSAKTTIVIAADPESTSGKAQKARDLTSSGKANIQIMSIKQFKEFIA